MSGSCRYLAPLDSLRTMLSSYPTRAEISAIHFTVDPWTAVGVRLGEAEPARLAAGLVEWQRTLGSAETWVWRTPNGRDLHFAIAGYGSECAETPVLVLAGPVPYDERLDVDLAPGASEQLRTETLYAWFGAEIVRTWPFSTNHDTDGVDR